MDHDVGAVGKLAHPVAHGGVTADRDAGATAFDQVSDCRFDGMVVDGHAVRLPAVELEHLHDLVACCEGINRDRWSGSRRRGRLAMERLIVERLQTAVSERARRPLRRDNPQRVGGTGGPPCDRQGGEIAEVIGVVMGDQHRPHGRHIETGGEHTLGCRPTAINQHPRRLVDHRDRRPGPIGIRVRRPAAENDDLDHIHIVPDATTGRVPIVSSGPRCRAGESRHGTCGPSRHVHDDFALRVGLEAVNARATVAQAGPGGSTARDASE